MKQAYLMLIILASSLGFTGCMPTQMVRELKTPGEYDFTVKEKFLKVHMQDGSLYVLDSWIADDTAKIIYGTGNQYNAKRDITSFRAKDLQNIKNYKYEICYEDITLVEVNRLKHHSANLAAITIVGAPLALMTIYCLTNPKACFGSCPTFYTQNDGQWQLVAEGFSSSILPVFEKRDVDMLYHTKNETNHLQVKLTNEALETHVIRYANILAFPQKEGQRVFATGSGDFYSITRLISPQKCESLNGPCVEKVKYMDKTEQFSLTDSKNLAEKEELYFSFNNTSYKNPGLVVASRQTLLTTYLFYQGLAYSGNYTGYFAAGIENGNQLMKNRVQKLWDKLGVIEIYMKNKAGKWEKVGEVDEMGPIASDLHLVKLPEGMPENTEFKLKMTQGLWRIDYLAMGEIVSNESPVVIQPEFILKDETRNEESLKLLTDTAEYLVTYPGDSYLLQYPLPDSAKYEFFLDSKGYYLEWMRDEWLAEQDLKKARLMFAFPGWFMRKAAKPFKETEAEMEDKFWGSRYVQN